MALEDAGDEVDAAFTRQDPRGLTYEAAYGGALSFLRRRYTKDLTDVDVAITGVPFDLSVTNRPGCRLGPRAIREASTLQPYDPPYGWGFDPLSEFTVVDYGDLAFDYGAAAAFPDALTAHIAGIVAAGAAPLTMGGDHYISYPILRALAAEHGPLSLLQFDAHSDTWPDEDRARLDHGTMFYKAVKDGLIDPHRSVQVGIRTTNETDLGIHVIDAREVHEHGPVAAAQKVRDILGQNKTYLTFDIDCLDPGTAPGTGTPVWGGLSAGQAAILLRDLAGISLVGGDIVEVSPPFDPSGATAVAGAHVLTEILCLWAWTRRT